MNYQLMIKTAYGYHFLSADGMGQHTTSKVLTECLEQLAPGGIVLRTQSREVLNHPQLKFVNRNTCALNVAPNGMDPMRNVIGSARYIQKAKAVGYVLGIRVGDYMLWDDGTFTKILKGASAQFWRVLPHRLPVWDGSDLMFN